MRFGSIGSAGVLALGAGLMLASAGCSGSQVPFQVVFPSEETFVVMNTMRVRVFGAAESSCSNLAALAAAGIGIPDTALFTRDAIEPCELRSGMTFPDTGAGDRVFLVEGIDASGNNILVGCAQDQVYGGATVRVTLSTTDDYQAAFMMNPPTQSAAERCGGGV